MNNTNENWKELWILDQLKRLKTEVLVGESLHESICTFLIKQKWKLFNSYEALEFGTPSKYLDKAFLSWPKFSGRLGSPVPDPRGGSAFKIWYETTNMWEGEYGELRMELLDHCINYLETKLGVNSI